MNKNFKKVKSYVKEVLDVKVVENSNKCLQL